MNTVKSIYKKAPSSIPVPKELRKRNIEVIFMPIEEEKEAENISSYFGALPDFPDRAPQGDLQTREQF